MSKKEITVQLIIGTLVMMIIVMPILRLLGIPSFEDILDKIFGDNEPLKVVISLLAAILVILWAYKIFKK